MTIATKKLLEYWSRSELVLGSPVSPHDLDSFEENYSVRLPTDVRDCYLAANGFVPPRDQDANGFSFWPLEKVRLVSEFEGARWSTGETRNCFLFADYLSLSWGYAVQLSGEAGKTKIGVVGTTSGRIKWIADSFSEFVDLYIGDDACLYPGRDAS